MSAIAIRRALAAYYPDVKWMRVRRVNDTTRVQIMIGESLRDVRLTTIKYPHSDLVISQLNWAAEQTANAQARYNEIMSERVR